jgi:hypothetical protein
MFATALRLSSTSPDVAVLSGIQIDFNRRLLTRWSPFGKSEPDPTTSIYNASIVNVYNAMGSLVRFES